MRYRVTLTREVAETCDVEVEADSPEQAKVAALAKAGEWGEDLYNWDTTDAVTSCPYVDGDGAIEEDE